MSEPPTAVNLNDTSIFEQSSPESLRARALSPSPVPHTHERQSSTSEDQVVNTDIEDNFSHHNLKQYASNRSSISSLPASIIHNTLLSEYEDGIRRTPSKLLERSDSPISRLYAPGYMHGFRNPSSVRALQLGESEYTDTDTPSVSKGYKHRKVPKISYFSPRSPGSIHSSPTKRSSRPNTPQHQRQSSKLKKDFPLVLLHCTILPPAVATRISEVADDLYEAVLPEEYKKRWRTLQDKVAKNSEVCQRGVLIPHPHEDYDLLEERLLESLELERPRIRQHHFLGPKDVDGPDSGFESSSQTDEGSDNEAEPIREKCPDCGTVVSSQVEQERKWQIKIYAANGLMKAGAWAAAWQEMEKVDVEVGIWMPEDVRAEVDERLTSLQAQQEAEKPVSEPTLSPAQASRRHRSKSAKAKLRHEERMKEIYGEPIEAKTQAEIDGLEDGSRIPAADPLHRDASSAHRDFQDFPDLGRPHVTFAPEPVFNHGNQSSSDTISFLRNHLSSILSDQKSVAILLLSFLVLFFAIQNTTSQPGKAANVALSPTEPHVHHASLPPPAILQNGPSLAESISATVAGSVPQSSATSSEGGQIFSPVADVEEDVTSVIDGQLEAEINLSAPSEDSLELLSSAETPPDSTEHEMKGEMLSASELDVEATYRPQLTQDGDDSGNMDIVNAVPFES